MLLIKKEILNDQRFREKKTLIFQAETGPISDTLFDSSQAQRLQNQSVYAEVVCRWSLYRSFLSRCYRRSEFGGMNHLALTCSDMQRTVDFYTNILGMKLVKTLEFTHESGSGQHFFFDVGNGRDAIAFFWFEDAPPPAPGIAQSGRWLPGAPRRSAIGAMDHVALDVPRDKIEAYRDKLRAKGIDVTEVVNHSDRPGIDQYLPAEPNEDTFVRSIYFQDPDGITLEFAC